METNPTALQTMLVQVARHAGWSLKVPSAVMMAVYAGSRSKPTYYVKHFDGGGPGLILASLHVGSLMNTPHMSTSCTLIGSQSC